MAESKYDENFPERAMDFASEGMTDSQITNWASRVQRSTTINSSIQGLPKR